MFDTPPEPTPRPLTPAVCQALDTYGEVFTYPVGLEDNFTVLRRNRKTGCWPIFFGPLLVGGAIATVQGGTNWWIGPVFLVFFPFCMWFLEHQISATERESLRLQTGFLTYDGKHLRQHDESGTVLAEINTGDRIGGSTLTSPTGWTITARQGDQRLTLTSSVSRARRVAIEILGFSDPDSTD